MLIFFENNHCPGSLWTQAFYPLQSVTINMKTSRAFTDCQQVWALTLSQCYQWQYLYIIETKLLVFSFSSLKIMPFPSVFLHIQFLNILNEQKGFLKAFVWFGCWFLKYISLFYFHGIWKRMLQLLDLLQPEMQTRYLNTSILVFT